MTKGRKPQQPELVLAKGNPGKRRVVGLASQQQAGSIIAPVKLSPKAKAVWNELVTDLERMNFLRPTDRYAFARYCRYMARWILIDDGLKPGAETYWTETPHGKMKRIDPMFQVLDRIDRRLEAYEAQFGLMPAARQQIMLRLSQQSPVLPLEMPGEKRSETSDEPVAGPIGILGQVH